MSEPMTMTDIEFLKLPELNQQSHLYLYQENSALLRPAVRTKVAGQALVDGRALRDIATYSQRIQKPRSLGAESEAAGSAHADRDGLSGANQNDALDEATKSVLLPSLSLTVSEVSLFGDTLAVLDLGERGLKDLPLADIERTLLLIAHGEAEQSLCLLVSETHDVVKTDAWRAAVSAIGLIEEPMVTVENYLAVARSYFPQSRLGDLRHLSDNRRFLTRLRKFVEQGPCTPFALSIEIDIIVLGEMDSGEFREINEIETKRRDRWVLPEALRRFLDNRDTPSFSALMLLVDHLRHRRMLEPDEILTRLYRATAGTLDSRDKRYRRLEDPSHCAWAALLLASENSFIKGNAFVSMDYVGQRYGRAAASPAWFASNDGWQTIAPLLEIGALEKLSRLVNARLELQRTLRRRLEAMESSDIAWFHSLIRSSDGPRAAESSNGQPPVVIAEAD